MQIAQKLTDTNQKVPEEVLVKVPVKESVLEQESVPEQEQTREQEMLNTNHRVGYTFYRFYFLVNYLHITLLDLFCCITTFATTMF